jgi:hypothetical protein
MFEVIRSANVWEPIRDGLLIRRSANIDLSGEDLPCPWCHADTTEGDPRCPSCGRRFG